MIKPNSTTSLETQINEAKNKVKNSEKLNTSDKLNLLIEAISSSKTRLEQGYQSK